MHKSHLDRYTMLTSHKSHLDRYTMLTSHKSHLDRYTMLTSHKSHLDRYTMLTSHKSHLDRYTMLTSHKSHLDRYTMLTSHKSHLDRYTMLTSRKHKIPAAGGAPLVKQLWLDQCGQKAGSVTQLTIDRLIMDVITEGLLLFSIVSLPSFKAGDRPFPQQNSDVS